MSERRDYDFTYHAQTDLVVMVKDVAGDYHAFGKKQITLVEPPFWFQLEEEGHKVRLSVPDWLAKKSALPAPA